jgi:hypothetical protein
VSADARKIGTLRSPKLSHNAGQNSAPIGRGSSGIDATAATTPIYDRHRTDERIPVVHRPGALASGFRSSYRMLNRHFHQPIPSAGVCCLLAPLGRIPWLSSCRHDQGEIPTTNFPSSAFRARATVRVADRSCSGAIHALQTSARSAPNMAPHGLQ